MSRWFNWFPLWNEIWLDIPVCLKRIWIYWYQRTLIFNKQCIRHSLKGLCIGKIIYIFCSRSKKLNSTNPVGAMAPTWPLVQWGPFLLYAVLLEIVGIKFFFYFKPVYWRERTKGRKKRRRVSLLFFQVKGLSKESSSYKKKREKF